jgi:hypothetical protein
MAAIPVIELSGLGLVMQWLSQLQPLAREPRGLRSYKTQGEASVVRQSQRSPSPCSRWNEAEECYHKPSYDSWHGSQGEYCRERSQEWNQEGYDQTYHLCCRCPSPAGQWGAAPEDELRVDWNPGIPGSSTHPPASSSNCPSVSSVARSPAPTSAHPPASLTFPPCGQSSRDE